MRELRYIKIGTEEYPIPIKCEEYAVKNANGETEVESRVVWANSEEDAFYIPTYREESDDVIYGMFKRKVESDPNMLDEMVELLTRLDPVRTKSENNGRKSQKSYAYTTIGTPGNGKTFMMQALGEIVHPKGAMLINCQQLREAEEIFKKVQIGVSKSSKRKCIDAYIYSTNIGEKEFSPNTVAYIKSVLGNDFCTQETRDGKRITAIDWNNTDASADVIERVCDEIIQREGINYKEENGNVGITTTNGPLIEALFDKTNPNYGRMVILDEYNRLPEDDGLLTMQAFFSEPGKDKLELEGADNKVYTIRREDIPETFLLLGTANQAIEGMGESIKRQSRPVISRQGQGIDIKLISAPTKADYISRTLKHLTGVPAYYVYKADEDGYLKNPSYLKEILEDFRTVGLSKDEIKEIPKEEMYNIKHIDRTLKVATAYGTLLYETDRLIQELAHEDTLPMEYTEYLKHEAVVDLRYIFKLLQHSKLEKPQGESGEEVAKKLMRRKRAAEKPQNQDDIAQEIEDKIKGSYKRHMLCRGTKLENEIAEKVTSFFKPKDLSEKLRNAPDRENCLNMIDEIMEKFKKRAASLKFEFAAGPQADGSGIKTLFNAKEEDFPSIAIEGLKDLLVTSISEAYGEKLSAASITDDESLQNAINMLSLDNNESNYVVPNLDIETSFDEPLKKVIFAENKEQLQDVSDLLTTEQFIKSLSFVQMRKYNMNKLMNEASIKREENIFSDEVSRVFHGEDENVFTAIIMLNKKELDLTGKTEKDKLKEELKKDAKGIDGVYEDCAMAQIIYNKESNYTIVVGDFDITESDAEKLSKGGVLFINSSSLNCQKEAEKLLDKVYMDITSNMVKDNSYFDGKSYEKDFYGVEKISDEDIKKEPQETQDLILKLQKLADEKNKISNENYYKFFKHNGSETCTFPSYIPESTIKDIENLAKGTDKKLDALVGALNNNFSKNADATLIANALYARIDPVNADVIIKNDDFAKRVLTALNEIIRDPKEKQKINTITLTSQEYGTRTNINTGYVYDNGR